MVEENSCPVPSSVSDEGSCGSEAVPPDSLCPPAPGPTSDQNNDIFNDLHEFDDDMLDNEDNAFQCENCSSKFMSSQSMRIHAVKCKSRQQPPPSSPVQSASAEMSKNNELKRY